jgi:hypothetical protein
LLRALQQGKAVGVAAWTLLSAGCVLVGYQHTDATSSREGDGATADAALPRRPDRADGGALAVVTPDGGVFGGQFAEWAYTTVCTPGDHCSERCTGDCTFDCRQVDLCELECESGSTCATDCREGDDCNVECAAGASCAGNCAGSDDCEFFCETDSYCVLDCSEGDCDMHCDEGSYCDLYCAAGKPCAGTLKCDEGARCSYRCDASSSDCAIDCDGSGSTCADGLLVCNRACP